MQEAACTIDDFGPLPVHRPQSVAELCDLVRRAAADGQAVYPLGGRTMLNLGLPPTKPGIAIDLTALDQVIDYPARDMTITVHAGITIARLQEILAAEYQCLPIDVPDPERATLGGAIATNAAGPRRYGHGTFRDYVLGTTVVNDEGQEVKAGGRVVKNVAGYDLCKLYTGSLGTLGVITQVTLKVRPQPETRVVLVTSCAADTLADLMDRLHATSTRPMSLEATSPTPLDADFQVMIGYEGNKEAVEWQAEKLQQELSGQSFSARWGMNGTRDIELLSGQSLLKLASPLAFKANLRPANVASFLQMVQRLPFATLDADAGSGMVVGHGTSDLTLAQIKPILTTLLDAAAAEQGNLVLLRCPPAWKRELPVWGRPRGDVFLMRAIKDKLDPRGIFNPGRFVDGI